MAITTPFAAVEDALQDIREGRIVVVVDDPDRENEGDLVIAAQFATPDAIKDRGRMIGDFLLAMEETKGVR